MGVGAFVFSATERPDSATGCTEFAEYKPKSKSDSGVEFEPGSEYEPVGDSFAECASCADGFKWHGEGAGADRSRGADGEP